MIRHQQLDQSTAGGLHFVGGGLHCHAGLNLANTGGGIHTLANIHHADAAYAHRGFVLLMAERWDGNAVKSGCVKNGGARRNRDWNTVNGDRHQDFNRVKVDLYLSGAFRTHAFAPCGKQTPAGHRRLVRCSSTTSRKCFSTEAIGTGTTWPRPQIEVCFRACDSSSSN